MRRSRFALAALLAVILLCAGYGAFWWIVASQIESGVFAWRDAQRAQKVDVSWRGFKVSGFPLGWRVTLEDAVLRDRRRSPAPEISFARLVASARPWRPTAWRLSLPAGLAADLPAAAGRTVMAVRARRAIGSASLNAQRGISVWLRSDDVAAEAGGAVAVKSADAWIALPPERPRTHTDPNIALAFDLHGIRVPDPPVGFGPMIDDLALGFTMRGPLPEGPVAPAVAAWRDAGGTIDVDHLHVEWGGLGITANGTLALDQKLQPIAAFSGGVEGFGAVLNALVAADMLTEEQASLVEIALNTLAKPGPDGKPQIMAPFAIQNGRVYIGPARLGRMPPIRWE